MWDQRFSHRMTNDRFARPTSAVSPATCDTARGAANLVSVPRAGNVSSDTRAG